MNQLRLIPKLRLGDPFSRSSASRHGKQSFQEARSQAGAWERGKSVHVHDLHATILHVLGLDHELLTYFHNGRDERPTYVAGRVVREILASERTVSDLSTAPELTTIATFLTPSEAGLAKSRLAEHGIQAILDGEFAVGTLTHLGIHGTGGVKLQVSAADTDRAREILSSRVQGVTDVGEEWTSSSLVWVKRLGRWIIIALLLSVLWTFIGALVE